VNRGNGSPERILDVIHLRLVYPPLTNSSSIRGYVLPAEGVRRISRRTSA
jgi:hypothetical protein